MQTRHHIIPDQYLVLASMGWELQYNKEIIKTRKYIPLTEDTESLDVGKVPELPFSS